MQRTSKIDRRQRLIAILLLAFGVDTLRPAVHPVAHSHARGERPHVHVGDVLERRDEMPSRSLLAGITLDPPLAKRAQRPAISAPSTLSLHVHLVRPLQAAHVAPLTPNPLIQRVDTLPARKDGQERAPCVPTGHARAPPTAAA